MGFIAVNLIGPVSEIYRNVLQQPFHVFQQFHGLSARMMLHTMGFRALTNQWGPTVDKLQPLTHEDVEQKLVECMNRKLNRGGSKCEGLLEKEEIQHMATVVMAGLDTADCPDNEVSVHEFVRSAASAEVMNMNDFVEYFDVEADWKNPLARVLDPTRREIINTLTYGSTISRSRSRQPTGTAFDVAAFANALA